MKKTSKKIISLIVALVIIITSLAIMPITSSAAESPQTLEKSYLQIWADAQHVIDQQDIADFKGGNKLSLLGGISPFKRSTSSSSYYWFLPSTADCSALTLWFEGTAKIDGTEIISGTPTNALAEINVGGVQKVITLTLDGSNYSVTCIKSGDVGTVYIDTDSGSLTTINSDKHTTYESGSIMVVQPDGDVDYYGIMEKMSGRGNGTWSAKNNKNPYNIKLAVSKSLLGMGQAKKWCLLASTGSGNDDSLVRNQLTYDFADYIGIKYQPHCKPVDLYVNQQYLGSYQLAQKVEIKSNRIDINDAYENLEFANGTTDAETGIVVPTDFTGTASGTYDSSGASVYNSYQYDNASLRDKITIGRYMSSFADHSVGSRAYSPSIRNNPTDTTGGYLYELEISNRWVTENAGFCAYNRQGWVIKSCDYATKEMVDYSYDLLYALGSAIYNNGIVPSTQTTTTCSKANTYVRTTTNPAPASIYQGLKWSDILDADSAVKYYWTQEFFKNMDSSTSSTYFYKDSSNVDSKLYAGPLWDMDNSIGYDKNGSRWGCTWTSAENWYTKKARIYRFYYNNSTTTYSTDDESPLNFYAALASNSDFWTAAERYWYKYISPAADILTGKAVDNTGKLKSIAEYVNTVSKSGLMDAIRHDQNNSTYDAQSKITGMTNWLTARQSWIDGQISKKNISYATASSISTETYTGSEITPEPVVSYSGTVLEKDVDYTLSYTDNIEVGTAYINITGIGTYTGTKTFVFNIAAAPASSLSVEIENAAYKDTLLSAAVKNSLGDELSSSFTCQWNRNGEAISGATGETYLTTTDDIGSKITVTITGDGKNITGNTASNECTVLDGERPTGYTRTIAEWNYDFTANSAALATADPTGEAYYYTATGGENQSSSNLYASVNAKDNAKIKWSGTADLYKNTSTSVTPDQSPVMSTSKTDGLAWGQYPYFETVVSTAGYEGIKFSAKLGGTKKGPKSWKLQYSLNGTTYTDIDSSTYSIAANKAMEQAFDNVALPSVCDNQKAVYIRAVVCDNVAINGVNTVIDQLSGDASINNIAVTGSSLSVVTSLYEPTITSDNGTSIYNDNLISIKDNNGGADVYYSVNGSEAALYTGQFNPFDVKNASVGDTATVTAYSKFEDIVSDEVTETFTFAGININSFSYDTYSADVANGAVASTGGVYGKSGKMTACTNGISQYVPLWNESNKAFCVAPDDGALWTESSGFTYRISTAGYENINFSCKAYTTNQGPNSVQLQYSTNGIDFINVTSSVPLTAAGLLEQAFSSVALPAECDNLSVLYIRLATTENLTFTGTTLHNNASKGNLYVNDVVIGGEDNGCYKMPYTNKSTSYFGLTGTVNYYSPDGLDVNYAVLDKNNKLVGNGVCPATGIQLSSMRGFNGLEQEPYTVLSWVTEDSEQSAINRATYYYKGDSIVKFSYNDTTRLFANYVSADFTTLTNTSGANSGTLTMYPDASNKASFTYTNTYGIKVTYDATKPFAATKKLDNPNGNGYWLIETSSLGYKNLTLNLEQLSSNNGPRDWGIAYSTNGSSYTYVANSNVRCISNDACSSTVETYANLALPSECNNREKLYIKVFINGGEGVDGDELSLATKGNTGINKIELSGNAIVDFDVDSNGYVNAKDYALITKNDNGQYSLQNQYSDYFANYITTAQ